MTNKKSLPSQWIDQHTESLLSWALHKVSDNELAKDLVQDTFLAAAEKIDSFREESSPKTWLFSILNYKIIDHYRAKKKEPGKYDDKGFSLFFNNDGEWNTQSRPSDWDDEGHLLDNGEFRAVLKACMEQLPEKWSACIKLKYLMNKNRDEICQALGISTTNFWQMVHRAKLSVRDCIETNWFITKEL